MNLYFLVEGRRTEKKLYPAWLSYYLPHLQKVEKPEDAVGDSYHIISGNGYPSILKQTHDAIITINDLEVVYDYLIIAVDSDEVSYEERKKEISAVASPTLLKGSTKLVVIVQNKCIETWLLGNKKLCPRNPACTVLQECLRFYDIREHDPELMEKPDTYEGSVALYHDYYLDRVFKARTDGRMVYNKNNPGEAAQKHYWDALTDRYKQTKHIQSFGELVMFFEALSKECKI